MAMPKSTPRRPVKPGQNRDSRDGVFGHPKSQVGPLPRVGLYARVSTPHQHTIGMQLRQLREFLERRRWQKVLVVEEVVSGIQAAPGERPSTRRCAPARDRHHPERTLPISGPAGSLRVIFHAVAAHAPPLCKPSVSHAGETTHRRQRYALASPPLFHSIRSVGGTFLAKRPRKSASPMRYSRL